LYGGKATTSVGLASSLGRNYRRYVACERRAQYLEDPEHQGVLRADTVGEREELQKELDLVKKHSSISLKRSRDMHISRVRSREGLSRWSTRTRRWGKRSEMQA
jgi:hypothetical protein